MATPTAPFDKQDQYDRIKESLLAGESITAVYDCIGTGTGFIGLTDKRVILQDNSLSARRSPSRAFLTAVCSPSHS
jgi:hypothetical protein